MADYQRLRGAAAEAQRGAGCWADGLSSYVEICGWRLGVTHAIGLTPGGWESATVRSTPPAR